MLNPEKKDKIKDIALFRFRKAMDGLPALREVQPAELEKLVLQVLNHYYERVASSESKEAHESIVFLEQALVVFGFGKLNPTIDQIVADVRNAAKSSK